MRWGGSPGRMVAHHGLLSVARASRTWRGEVEFASSRDVAQSGSALQWGCRGRGFKSRRPDDEADRCRPRVVSVDFNSLHFGDVMRLFPVLFLFTGALACGRSSKAQNATKS